MAEIKDVTLQIQPGSNSDKKKVTVGFKLTFSAAEAGKTFRYGISLRGEDKTGDDEASFLSTGQLLYTFLFGGVFPKPLTHKSVTAQVGEQSFSETREVSIEKLNEDPGFDIIKPDINTTLKIPHPDEVYATVNLVADEERSPAVTLLL
jgi:hypothetical protein